MEDKTWLKRDFDSLRRWLGALGGFQYIAAATVSASQGLTLMAGSPCGPGARLIHRRSTRPPICLCNPACGLLGRRWSARCSTAAGFAR